MALVDQVSSSAELDDLLEKCIKVANYSKARRLIQEGSSVHGTINGMPYLTYFVNYGNIKMARVLVEHGALNNPSINLESLLDESRRYGRKQMVNVLLQQESTDPEECIQSLLDFIDTILSAISIFKRNIVNEEDKLSSARRSAERSQYISSREDELQCIVDPRNGKLISQTLVDRYVNFILQVYGHAYRVLKYFDDQPEQVLQYAQNHSPIKYVLGFVHDLRKQARELKQSYEPRYFQSSFRCDLKSFFREFFDPAVAFVSSLEKQMNEQKLVLQESVPTRAAVPDDRKVAIPESAPADKAHNSSLTVDKALSFLETYLSTADASDKVRLTARLASICCGLVQQETSE